MFKLHCRTRDGTPVELGYDPHTSAFVYDDGTPVVAASSPVDRAADAIVVSALQPGRKSRTPSTLKIQLGLGCNYSCSYCSQANEIGTAAATRTADAHAFVEGLDQWLAEPPSRIEFWGGEPLVYIAKLRVLLPELDRRFPDARFSMVSNGSLLDDETVDLIDAYDIDFSMSHDGPAQAHRGPDPFDDPERARCIRQLWALRKPHRRMTFNVVLTPGNADPERIRRWFVERVGDPDVVVAFEGVVATYDASTRDGVGRWTPAQYDAMRESIAGSLEGGTGWSNPTLRDKARDFVGSLATRRTSASLGQKCGMDRVDQLAVDLHGNVLTCQNTGGTGRHRIGSTASIEDVRLDTSTHWSLRPECPRCPVLQLCQGSCMYLHDAEFRQSCDNEYQYNLGVLDGVLRRMLGLRLLTIEGAERPPARRSIPIRALAAA